MKIIKKGEIMLKCENFMLDRDTTEFCCLCKEIVITEENCKNCKLYKIRECDEKWAKLKRDIEIQQGIYKEDWHFENAFLKYVLDKMEELEKEDLFKR